ncbi:MAG: MASE3 domain-containing protein [Methanomicrobiales archaeon]
MYRNGWLRAHLGSVGVLGVFLLITALTSLYSYLLFHTTAELFSIIIAGAIFIIAWNSREYLDNQYLLFLGIGYLFIAGIDLVHTLAYSGMNIFTGYGANLPTQLWIAGRSLEAATLIAAPLMIRRRLYARLLGVVYAAIFALLMASIFWWGIFPDCYIEGAGLTPFKIYAEYVISGALALSILFLWQRREAFERDILDLVILSIIATIGSEIAFTFYVSVYGFSNLVGHLLKIISFALIYFALVESGIRRPYDLIFRNLKQNEEELRRSEERFHAIIEDQTEFICRFLPDGTHLFVNEAYAAYFDMSPEELVGRSFRPTIHPDDRERVRAFFASLSPDHPVDSIEHRIIMPGGEVRWQWWNDRAIFDDQGHLIEYQSVGRDITDRKQAREALEENRRQLEEAMDLAHMARWEFDIASGIFTFNDRFYALYATTAGREGGYQMPAEVYAREFVHPDDRHVVADEVEKARETRDPRFMSRIEHRIIRRDGEVRSMVVRTGVSLDEAGRPVKTHGVNQDITERREAEEELQREKDLFESTFESLRDAAFVLGADPVVIRMANAAAEKIFGYSRDEMVGRTTGFLHVDEAALARFHEHVYPFLERGESIPRFRFTMKRKDGTVFPTENAMTPLYGPEGAHTGWISLVRDITPEVEAERREEQAMRQLEENMEQLATLNDQIRNPLAVIVGLVDMDCPGTIGAVMKQAERINDIITLLDAGWVRSEKTWEFLHRHYHLGDETPELQGKDTEDRE